MRLKVIVEIDPASATHCGFCHMADGEFIDWCHAFSDPDLNMGQDMLKRDKNGCLRHPNCIAAEKDFKGK